MLGIGRRSAAQSRDGLEHCQGLVDNSLCVLQMTCRIHGDREFERRSGTWAASRQHLAYVFHTAGELPCFGFEGIASQQISVVLQRRAAPGGIDNDSCFCLIPKRVDVVPRQSFRAVA